VEIAKDENVTSEEALGRFIEAVNSKTADTGVTAFLADDGKSIEYRATVGEGQTAASAQIAGIANFAATGAAAGSVGMDQMNIKTQAGAWESLQRIDSAIDKVNSARADLGAIQTRFEKSIENIDIMQENISAARGRITDADFAKETANLSRTQILQQAGTAMVAQANQLPQNVLKLLQ
jgi:flagellin